MWGDRGGLILGDTLMARGVWSGSSKKSCKMGQYFTVGHLTYVTWKGYQIHDFVSNGMNIWRSYVLRVIFKVFVSSEVCALVIVLVSYRKMYSFRHYNCIIISTCLGFGKKCIRVEGALQLHPGGADLERGYGDVQPWRPPFHASPAVRNGPISSKWVSSQAPLLRKILKF